MSDTQSVAPTPVPPSHHDLVAALRADIAAARKRAEDGFTAAFDALTTEVAGLKLRAGGAVADVRNTFLTDLGAVEEKLGALEGTVCADFERALEWAKSAL